MNKNPMLQTLLAMSSDHNTITIHKPMVDFATNLPNAMFFEQLLYWTPRAKDRADVPDGWVVKSDNDWKKELYVGRHTVRKSADYLISRKLIIQSKFMWSGSSTNAYLVDLDELEQQWGAFIQLPKRKWFDVLKTFVEKDYDQWKIEIQQALSEIEHSPSNATTQRPNSDTPPSENEHSSLTETTVTETTTKASVFGNKLANLKPDPRWNPTVHGDYSGFPESQWPYVIEFCLSFGHEPPRKSKKKGGTFSLWTSAIDDLIPACGEYGPKAIALYAGLYFKTIDQQIKKGNPEPIPHAVDSPKSIINKVRGYLAHVKSGAIKDPQTIYDYKIERQKQFENGTPPTPEQLELAQQSAEQLKEDLS